MNAKDNSRTSFDRQAATYDIDRNGSHARTVYRPVLEKLLALSWSSLLDVGAGTGEMLRMLASARPEARYSGSTFPRKWWKPPEKNSAAQLI